MQPIVDKLKTRIGGATKAKTNTIMVLKAEDMVMTIEIADRLVKLRKKYGYSQEELADKLGLSRQAVSKWERAEASPDTDNLICLAKLYGVSLDELLATDDDVDTIVNEQVKDKENEPEHEIVDDKVVINDSGVFLKSKNGKQVSITDDGVICYDKDGKRIRKKHKKSIAVLGAIEGGLMILAVAAFMLLGFLLNMWYNAWIVFFIPEIACSVARAIICKNPHKFNMPFLSCFVFFFVCMVLPGLEANLWHIMWVVFLAIPIYYITISCIDKALDIKRPEHDDDEFEPEEK